MDDDDVFVKLSFRLRVVVRRSGSLETRINSLHSCLCQPLNGEVHNFKRR